MSRFSQDAPPLTPVRPEPRLAGAWWIIGGMMDFRFLHLRGSDWRALADAVLRQDAPHRAGGGIGLWGLWRGHFGLASGDIYVILAGAVDDRPVAAGGGVEIVEDRRLVPTARPTDAGPCTRQGLYVFRRFTVRNADVDEIVRLSADAWRTFETSGRYTARPMGLFTDADRSEEIGEMLLVTWYDGFAAWAESRNFVPGARENFQRRRALTRSTIAVATALVAAPDAGPAIG